MALSPSSRSRLPQPRHRRHFLRPISLERLAWGELPGVVTAEEEHRSDFLATYATVHLEEEMRREAMVRDWPAFVRFLRLAATESGQILNYSKISREAGTLLGTDRFFFFDLGIRHAAAGLESSPAAVSMQPGPLFEQWVGIELWKRLQYLGTGRLYYLRTKDGAEVDFILERDDVHGQSTPGWLAAVSSSVGATRRSLRMSGLCLSRGGVCDFPVLSPSPRTDCIPLTTVWESRITETPTRRAGFARKLCRTSILVLSNCSAFQGNVPVCYRFVGFSEQ